MLHNQILVKARSLRKTMTNAEICLWSKLRNKQLGCRFTRQYIVDDKYIADFYCAKKHLIIELDGGQHYESAEDKARDEYFKSKNFYVLRFWNNDILENIEGCLVKISEVLAEL